MKKYWPVPLRQICLHIKKDIFFIFDLCFDVRDQLQFFLVTRFRTTVKKRQDGGEWGSKQEEEHLNPAHDNSQYNNTSDL